MNRRRCFSPPLALPVRVCPAEVEWQRLSSPQCTSSREGGLEREGTALKEDGGAVDRPAPIFRINVERLPGSCSVDGSKLDPRARLCLHCYALTSPRSPTPHGELPGNMSEGTGRAAAAE
ncbi:unnamed protein product [Pleuronectes platessa]|uniref:Uncharacterized protein n=1 Tax=Pleuronectes platessa TaxID=8262 RepID=A0A9N7W3Y9_PLEPL|nr:unnamed protein product [Pleuronectes platessa]